MSKVLKSQSVVWFGQTSTFQPVQTNTSETGSGMCELFSGFSLTSMCGVLMET